MRGLQEEDDGVAVSFWMTDSGKEGPYQDQPLLCPFRLSPLLTCS